MRYCVATVAAIALGLCVTACGSSGSSSSSASTGSSTSTAASTASSTTTAAAGTSGSKKVGIIDVDATDPLNIATYQGVEAAAKAAGWGPVSVVNTNGSADQANAALRTFASEHVGMVVDMAWPAIAIGAGLAAVRAAHIPVGGWGSGPGPGIVMTTGDGEGPFMAKATVSAVNGHGDVLGLFYQGGELCRERQAALEAALKQNPGIKLDVQQLTLPGEVQGASQFTTAWLAQHPKGSGNLAIWSCWDSPAYGVLSALRSQGRTDVKTISGNGSAQSIESVKNGQLTAEAWEPGNTEGQTVFNTTLQAIKAGSSWTPKTVAVPGVLVTKANVASFLAQHPDALK
jgi:ribose transport system substrate-binding protein